METISRTVLGGLLGRFWRGVERSGILQQRSPQALSPSRILGITASVPNALGNPLCSVIAIYILVYRLDIQEAHTLLESRKHLP